MLWELFETALTFGYGLFLVLAFLMLLSNMSRR